MFNHLSEDNFKKITLPRQSSLVNVSSFRALKTDVLFRSFSVKLVMEGCENYKINGELFKVAKDEVLLGNHFSEGKLSIDGADNVKGLCIDIAPDIITEVAKGFHHPDSMEYDAGFTNYFTSKDFVENKTKIGKTFLGVQLQEISKKVRANPDYQFSFTNEFYFELAETIVSEQYQFFNFGKNLNSLKTQTKKGILRKICLSKNYIDKDFVSIKSIEEVAMNCGISEYHFYRLFKQILGVSPYQYLLKKKLNYSVQLAKEQSLNFSDIAVICGFSDLSAFSKSFKKEFGISPTQYRHQNLSIK